MLDEMRAIGAERAKEARAARDATHVAALLAEVHALGRYPKEHERSEDPKKEGERTLALKLYEARAAGLLKPAETAEL